MEHQPQHTGEGTIETGVIPEAANDAVIADAESLAESVVSPARTLEVGGEVPPYIMPSAIEVNGVEYSLDELKTFLPEAQFSALSGFMEDTQATSFIAGHDKVPEGEGKDLARTNTLASTLYGVPTETPSESAPPPTQEKSSWLTQKLAAVGLAAVAGLGASMPQDAEAQQAYIAIQVGPAVVHMAVGNAFQPRVVVPVDGGYIEPAPVMRAPRQPYLNPPRAQVYPQAYPQQYEPPVVTHQRNQEQNASQYDQRMRDTDVYYQNAINIAARNDPGAIPNLQRQWAETRQQIGGAASNQAANLWNTFTGRGGR